MNDRHSPRLFRLVAPSPPRLVFSILLLIAAGCAGHSGTAVEAPATQPTGRNFVIWISVDGLRHDYVARHHPPALTRLSREGVWTDQLIPVFPSLTFPSHLAEACGVPVDRHGIPANAYYDTVTGKRYSFPHEAALLKAEPIWITAPRQNVRTVVDDWPVSQQQQDLPGPHSDYFNAGYDKDRTDEMRLDQLATRLQNDVADKDVSAGGRPLRLIMTYVSEVDEFGHKYGPDAPEIGEGLAVVDKAIDRFLARAIPWFEANSTAADELYVIITTDHGMTRVHTRVNLERLMGPAYSSDLHAVTSGPVANIYLNDVPAAQRTAKRDAILASLRQHRDVADVFAREELPPRWHYNDPTRSGDIVVSLKPGVTFTSVRPGAATRAAEGGGPRGMHGFDIADSPDMAGYAIIWSHRHKLGGVNLGRVDSTRFHATVARLLGIDPAAGATTQPIAIPPPNP